MLALLSLPPKASPGKGSNARTLVSTTQAWTDCADAVGAVRTSSVVVEHRRRGFRLDRVHCSAMQLEPCGMKCLRNNCAADWRSLRKITPKGHMGRIKLHRCLPCGRPVCSIHSVGAVTQGFGAKRPKERLWIEVKPGLCQDCFKKIIVLPPHRHPEDDSLCGATDADHTILPSHRPEHRK